MNTCTSGDTKPAKNKIGTEHMVLKVEQPKPAIRPSEASLPFYRTLASLKRSMSAQYERGVPSLFKKIVLALGAFILLQAAFTQLSKGDICGVKTLERLTESSIDKLEQLESRIRALERDMRKLVRPEDSDYFHPCMLSAQLGACDGILVRPDPEVRKEKLEDLYTLSYTKGL